MIEFDGIPTLSDPVMIAAFEGWNDAGESASATITHLREVWGADLITEFDSDCHVDLSTCTRQGPIGAHTRVDVSLVVLERKFHLANLYRVNRKEAGLPAK